MSAPVGSRKNHGSVPRQRPVCAASPREASEHMERNDDDDAAERSGVGRDRHPHGHAHHRIARRAGQAAGRRDVHGGPGRIRQADRHAARAGQGRGRGRGGHELVRSGPSPSSHCRRIRGARGAAPQAKRAPQGRQVRSPRRGRRRP